MGFIELRKDDQVSPALQEELDQLMPQAESTMDDVGNIYLDATQQVTPIGETGDLFHETIVESDGPLSKIIYSTSSHWDYVVGGHDVFGPIFSDLQRRWWFWYLNEVLGGWYENKTMGYYEGVDYPLSAFENAEPEIENRLDDFLNQIVG